MANRPRLLIAPKRSLLHASEGRGWFTIKMVPQWRWGPEGRRFRREGCLRSKVICRTDATEMQLKMAFVSNNSQITNLWWFEQNGFPASWQRPRSPLLINLANSPKANSFRRYFQSKYSTDDHSLARSVMVTVSQQNGAISCTNWVTIAITEGY